MSKAAPLTHTEPSHLEFNQQEEGKFTSVLAHVITAIAIGIIIGGSAATGTWFLTHGNVMWTGIAAGAGFVIPGLVSYVIFRCACGRTASIDQVVESKSEAVEAKVDTGESKLRADIKGTVYIHSLVSGPIRNDHMYEFSKRLKTEGGQPIEIREDDLYIELCGDFEKTFFLSPDLSCFRPSDKSTMTYIYLPACLFADVKEGDAVRFLLDDKLVELSCRQGTHPLPEAATMTFQDALSQVKSCVRIDKPQALWLQDIAEEPKFLGELVGRNLVKINGADSEIASFQFYEEDQKNHGAYQKLQVLDEVRNDCVFNLRLPGEQSADSRMYVKLDPVPLEEIDLFESKGFNGLRRLWILIPHKPEANQFPENASSMTIDARDTRGSMRFTKETFNPQKGHRATLYKHGQHFTCIVSENADVKLFYNQSNLLQLSVSLSSSRCVELVSGTGGASLVGHGLASHTDVG